jgi:large subunit ribosomal protein L32
MAVPKRKKSKSKTRTRRSALKATITGTKPCPQCGAAQEPHRICRSCGYYRGRQVVTVQAD